LSRRRGSGHPSKIAAEIKEIAENQMQPDDEETYRIILTRSLVSLNYFHCHSEMQTQIPWILQK